MHTLQAPPVAPDTDRPDPDDLYEILYNSAQLDYRRVKRRSFARRTILLIVTVLSVVGTFSVVFYPTFLKSRINNMKEEIVEYRSSKPQNPDRHALRTPP